MRGKVVSAAQQKIPDRITPAYAGKSCTAVPPALSSRDHPRLCGEKEYLTIGLVEDMGSPPPMRGKARQSAAAALSGRITPAYAGKSMLSLQSLHNWWDHPRLCGEKSKRFETFLLPAGSPPPMRGKDSGLCVVQSHFRITPAYAGKSKVMCGSGISIQDHPRLCGEKRIPTASAKSPKGSPPPMRGKAVLTAGAWQSRGITPAYAGKSGTAARHSAVRQDHPRLCGEKFGQILLFQLHGGSPPPMRGKVNLPDPQPFVLGITPAYAGKSCICSSFRSRFWDHPRLCGEKVHICIHVQNELGSPPPMRGKANGTLGSNTYAGITPAYAGKSHL